MYISDKIIHLDDKYVLYPNDHDHDDNLISLNMLFDY